MGTQHIMNITVMLPNWNVAAVMMCHGHAVCCLGVMAGVRLDLNVDGVRLIEVEGVDVDVRRPSNVNIGM